MKKVSILLIIMLLATILLTSCKLPEEMGKAEEKQELDSVLNKNKDDVMDSGPVRRGTLKLFSTKPDNLNPVLTNNIYIQNASKMVFESLVKLDKKQKPVPMLAEKWEVSPDGLMWTFYLKQNIQWHDKMPFSSEDVEFTIATILNPASNSVYRKNIENITTFASIDRNTFRIALKKPNSFTPELMTFPIIPKHYYVGEDVIKSQRNMKPVGTGPYKFLEYQENSVIKFIMNENWWNSKNNEKNAPELPYIHDVEVKIFDNVKDSLSAFQTRDIDSTVIMTGDSSKFSGRTDLTIKKFPSNHFEFIAFNLSNPILSDKVVRQAIAHAVNKTKLIDDILPGDAIASDLPVIPDTWLYDTNVLNYTPSPSKAKELLIQNGWKEENEVLRKRINGINTALELEILVNEDNETRFKAATAISEQLKAAGINLKVRKLPWEDEFKLINSRKFDMVLLGSTTTSIPDISFLYSSSEIASGRNISGYSNKSVDTYLEQMSTENDSSYKKALFLNMKSMINDEVPYIGLYFYNHAMLYNKKVKGELDPYLWDIMNNMTKWYIPVG
ncbi:MAG: peptide ABC transporter substrate-binding protein [Clostridia bacterium]|nr:peptide ABC transporter substrate-binding protein [Clostridia bacterium]